MTEMNIREFITIKSDRMNYEDFITGPQSFTIERLGKKNDQGNDRLLIFMKGRPDTPFWVPKGMAKCLANPSGWGNAPFSEWIGRSMTLFGEPTVVYGGKELGGVRISHISHIDAPYTTKISLRRGVRIDYEIQKMASDLPVAALYSAEKFDTALPAMLSTIKSGKMTLMQVIARCQQTGTLTADQLRQLKQQTPDQSDEVM